MNLTPEHARALCFSVIDVNEGKMAREMAKEIPKFLTKL